jgi:hypothetical protein
MLNEILGVIMMSHADRKLTPEAIALRAIRTQILPVILFTALPQGLEE